MKHDSFFCSRLCVGGALWCGLLLAAIPARSQTKAFPCGQIIEKVACQADASQSYALYLPSQYTPEKSWPLLYGFDPGGRGKQPVELFREAAEKYGWIVVGSHNSRNGPGVPLNDIIAALWQDTHERLAIDERRVYTTGMSGGARVATSVAIGLQDHVAGVIACGAGFPYAKAPQKDLHFAFFGIAGIEDFNLLELRQLEEPLTKAGMTHQLLTFDGEHSWPPPAILLEAVEWMEAHALKTGRSKDEARSNELYAQGWQRAQRFAAAAHPYDAWLRYRILNDAFAGLRAVEKGFADGARLEQAPEFAALRQESEFQAMLKRLKNPTPNNETK